MLFALTTASRASEITHLDVRYMVKSPLFYCFTLTKPTKVMFKGFEDNKNLCALQGFRRLPRENC